MISGMIILPGKQPGLVTNSPRAVSGQVAEAALNRLGSASAVVPSPRYLDEVRKRSLRLWQVRHEMPSPSPGRATMPV